MQVNKCRILIEFVYISSESLCISVFQCYSECVFFFLAGIKKREMLCTHLTLAGLKANCKDYHPCEPANTKIVKVPH